MTAYRLLNGASDGVPGIAVDRFDDVAVVHADSQPALERWQGVLQEQLPTRTAYAKVHPRQASRMNTDLSAEPLWGEAHSDVEVVENDVRYSIRPAAGLSVGLFLDMRDVRRWLRGQVRGARVLNLFAYTCAFGVCAMLGGAERVLNIDLSRAYLEWGKANYALNSLETNPRDFVYGDALGWLARLERRTETFDVVVVDPPSFSTTPKAAFSVERDYPRLLVLATRVVATRGMLLAATNHAGIPDQRFDQWLEGALAATGRRSRHMWRWHEPATDFPVPRGRWPYLKVRAVDLT